MNWQKIEGPAFGSFVQGYIEDNSIPEPNSGCWLWLLSYKGNGYGCSWFGGKSYRAHRLSYEAYKGRVPKGALVLHKCDNRMCVNPDHLFLGTHRDNVIDMIQKGRHIPSPSSGKPRASRKADIARVHVVRGLRANTALSGTQIANLLNIHQSHANRIISGKIGKTVPTIDYAEYYEVNLRGRDGKALRDLLSR